jgi:hypothetical protein
MAPGGVEASCEFETRSVTGTGSEACRDTLVMPCEDQELSGQQLQAKLEAWVAGGVMEGDVAAAVAQLHAHPEMLKAARSKVRGLAELRPHLLRRMYVCRRRASSCAEGRMDLA